MGAADPPHQASPAELKVLLEAQRLGDPFLVYRDAGGAQRLVALTARAGRLTVGRNPGNDVALDWDANVSRVHAALERVGDEWTLVDDGLSRNGSYVNGERVDRRRRLSDRDSIRVGETVLTFRLPRKARETATLPSAGEGGPPELTPAQRRVLRALCRPCRDPSILSPPATNRQIAGELQVTVDAVKANLRALFAKFEVGDLPQNAKRHALAAEALRTGAVSAPELSDR